MKIKSFHSSLLVLVFFLTTLYSFMLAYKRYVNFEYGKFDLGNMAQIVWNTSQGRFMEVTDQFGTNMPRWGMSHIDPILVLFAPFFKIYAHPMLLVFAQHALIISAIFPLFLLSRKKTNSVVASYLVVATYILYPAIGFTLVWTGFHGISFVAPLFIWMVWFLEKNEFLVHRAGHTKVLTCDSAGEGETSKGALRPKAPRIQHGKLSYALPLTCKLIIYWLLIVLMLMGKEEVGAILALSSIFLYFKNKKLAIQTFIVSTLWFLIAFFIIVPSYANLRQMSIATFVNRTGVNDVNPEAAARKNFFFQRYSYLGNSYGEMVKNLVLRPRLALDVTLTSDKIDAINHLLAPLGYVAISMPVWLVSVPDLAIMLLSKDAIFDISNHRVAFVVSSLFISYVYFLCLLNFKVSKLKSKIFRYVPVIAASGVLLLTVYFSGKTQNPLFVSGKGFVQNKILSKALAHDVPSDNAVKYTIGDTRSAKVPRNDVKCLNDMVSIIKRVDPDIYSGPDYLGAHSSLRKVNALFPARFWDADLVIADLFETKSIGPLESSGWTFNKEGLRRLLDSGKYTHLYSCGKISAFVKGSTTDSSIFVDELDTSQVASYKNGHRAYTLETEKISLDIVLSEVPNVIDKDNPGPFVLVLSKEKGEFLDKTTFWTFENADDARVRMSFVDYLSIGSRQGLDRAALHQKVVESYTPKLSNDVPSGNYHIFYGVGDLLDAKELYVGSVVVM